MADRFRRVLAVLALVLLMSSQKARTEQELRFKPVPRQKPVRLFTETELARYNGQETTGVERDQSPRITKAYRGKQHKIADKEGLKLLRALNIEAPMELIRALAKRPHSASPPLQTELEEPNH
ncbi:UNVERIFIED_CONTAM: hypothetical protein K2H54_048340 [Gekko kuhli]